MDIDVQQIEIIMSTIVKMGEMGGSAFYAWLFFDKVIPAVVWLIAFYMIYKFASTLLSCFTFPQYLIQLRDLLHIGCAGALTEEESQIVVRKVIELKAENEMLLKEIAILRNKE